MITQSKLICRITLFDEIPTQVEAIIEAFPNNKLSKPSKESSPLYHCAKVFEKLLSSLEKFPLKIFSYSITNSN